MKPFSDRPKCNLCGERAAEVAPFGRWVACSVCRKLPEEEAKREATDVGER